MSNNYDDVRQFADQHALCPGEIDMVGPVPAGVDRWTMSARCSCGGDESPLGALSGYVTELSRSLGF